jgi:hypothetical protein
MECPRNPLTGRCVKDRSFANLFAPRQTRRRTRAVGVENPCPPGTRRNPSTRRCIKAGSRMYRKLFPEEYPIPQPRHAATVYPQPPQIPALFQKRQPREELIISEPSLSVPKGHSAIAPLADRATIYDWIRANCRNRHDPLTRHAFAEEDTVALRDLVRLHNRTCAFVRPLNQKVAGDRAKGQLATIPGTHELMTDADYDALRAGMRRHDPDYKIPRHRHAPPPANWQLYVASDERSGPDFATVAYVDVTKAYMTAQGPVYPPQSMRIDLGVIPLVEIPGICSAQDRVNLIARLAAENKLVVPTASGWKPVAGMPFTRDYWYRQSVSKLSAFCTLLSKALAE